MAGNLSTMAQILGKVYEITIQVSKTTRLAEVSNRLLGLVQNLVAKEKTLKANPNLTDVGRFNELKKAVSSFFADLTWFRAERRTAQERLAALHRKLFTLEKSDRTGMEQELRNQELRAEIRNLPQSERDRAYLFASNEDDIELLRALQDAPGLKPLITPEMRHRADDARAQRIAPEEYASFKETTELLEALQIIGRELEGLATVYQVDLNKLPLTEDEINDRVQQAIDTAFGRRVVMS